MNYKYNLVEVPSYQRSRWLLTRKILSNVTSTRFKTYVYSLCAGILVPPPACPKCDGPIGFKKDPAGILELGGDPSKETNCFKYVCKAARKEGKRCYWEQSVWSNSIFTFKNTAPGDILLALNAFLAGSNIQGIMCATDWSYETSYKYMQIFQRVLVRD